MRQTATAAPIMAAMGRVLRCADESGELADSGEPDITSEEPDDAGESVDDAIVLASLLILADTMGVVSSCEFTAL